MALTYVRAIGSALAQGALTATWVAAGELPTPQRRLARAGAAASVAAVGWFSSDSSDNSDNSTEGTPSPPSNQPAGGPAQDDTPQPMDPRRVALTVVLSGLSIGMLVGRRHLEKRWLARLAAKGHEHPHRALALRLGLLSAAATLASSLQSAHAEQRRSLDLDRG
jgi:hypothetical protein